jgi:diaminopropionate ammonia-lyase
LARELISDVPAVCGESSTATIGVMMSGGNDIVPCEKLGSYGDTQVVLCRLEVATDSGSFENTVGMRSEAVFEAQKVCLSK